MAKAKTKTSDSAYFLKMVLYLIIGSQWVFFTDEGLNHVIPVPVGLIIGLLFTTHEHFKIDRKIEYAILLVAMLVGYVSDIGVLIKVLAN